MLLDHLPAEAETATGARSSIREAMRRMVVVMCVWGWCALCRVWRTGGVCACACETRGKACVSFSAAECGTGHREKKWRGASAVAGRSGTRQHAHKEVGRRVCAVQEHLAEEGQHKQYMQQEEEGLTPLMLKFVMRDAAHLCILCILVKRRVDGCTQQTREPLGRIRGKFGALLCPTPFHLT